ncbi:MAG: sugar 3,4-ketoisomerase [bacterium]
MKTWEILELKKMGDDLGYLVAIEEKTTIPFSIKRVFYVFDSKDGVVRGKHANLNSKFLLTCGKGSCKVRVDNTEKNEIIILDSPEKALYLDNMVWKEMYDFSPDCGLIVISDHHYDPDEYIYDYVEYCKLYKGM